MRKCGDGLPARPRGVTDAPSNLETPSVRRRVGDLIRVRRCGGAVELLLILN